MHGFVCNNVNHVTYNICSYVHKYLVLESLALESYLLALILKYKKSGIHHPELTIFRAWMEKA